MRKFVVPRLQAFLKKASASSPASKPGVPSRSDNKEQVADSFETEITAIVDDLLALPELVPDLIKEKLAEKLEEKKADTNPIGGPVEQPMPPAGDQGGAMPPLDNAPAEPLPEGGQEGEKAPPPPEGEKGAGEGKDELPSFMKEESASFVYIPKTALASWRQSLAAAQKEGQEKARKIFPRNVRESASLKSARSSVRSRSLSPQDEKMVEQIVRQAKTVAEAEQLIAKNQCSRDVAYEVRDRMQGKPGFSDEAFAVEGVSSIQGMAKVPLATFMEWVGADKDFVRVPQKVLSSWVSTLEKHACIPQAEMDAWYKEIASCVSIPKTVYAGWFERLEDSVMFSKAGFKNLLGKIESVAGLSAHKDFQALKTQICKAADDFSSDEVEGALNPVIINVTSPEPTTVKVEEVPAGQAAPLVDGEAAPAGEGCTCAEGTVCPTCSEEGSGAVVLPEGESVVSPAEPPSGEEMSEEIPDDVTAELTRVLENEASDPEDQEHEMDEQADKMEKRVNKETEELVGQMEKVMDSALQGGMKTIQQNAKASAPAQNKNCIGMLEDLLFAGK